MAKNAADFHLGTINVPFALQATRCLITLITKLIGGNLEYVKDVIEFSNTYGIFEQGSNKDTIFGVEPFGTHILAVLLDANS
jgi:hypothetical protein